MASDATVERELEGKLHIRDQEKVRAPAAITRLLLQTGLR